jgi:hypothetical protein
MRRVLYHVCIFGLPGVVVSYLVAWGLATRPWTSAPPKWHGHTVTTIIELAARMSAAEFDIEQRFGVTRAWVWATTWEPRPREAAPMPTWVDRGIRELARDAETKPPQFDVGGFMEAAGFPLHSSWMVVSMDEEAHIIVRGGYRFDPPPNASEVEDRLIAFRPIWSGLAVNAACYGLTLWCLVTVPGVVRRARRRRRGACLRCGYDLGGTASAEAAAKGPGTRCPECGGAV